MVFHSTTLLVCEEIKPFILNLKVGRELPVGQAGGWRELPVAGLVLSELSWAGGWRELPVAMVFQS